MYAHQGGTLEKDTNEYTNYAIKGELVHAFWEESTYKLAGLNPIDKEIEIKKILMKKLVDEMMNKNHIEFTRQEDFLTHTMIFRARAFIVPNSSVQLLRVQGVIK